MKRSVRIGVFETNSSSTHSITMCSEEEYEKWVSGDTVLYAGGKFYTRSEVIDIILKLDYVRKHYPDLSVNTVGLDKILNDCGAETYKMYCSNIPWGYSTFEESYTTKNGEPIVAFGYYGHDG